MRATSCNVYADGSWEALVLGSARQNELRCRMLRRKGTPVAVGGISNLPRHRSCRGERMTPRNSRTNRPAPRTSRAPQSARAVRSASRATQSERSASSAYRPAYTPGSQGRSANGVYGRQSAASQYSRTNPSYTAASSKRAGRGKKIALCVVAAVLVAVIGAGTAFALYINSINDQLNRGTKTQDRKSVV